MLIIGATGFVGSALARHFTAAGWSVSGVARTAETASILEAANVHALFGDLDDRLPAVLAAAAAVDVTIYAAQVPPDREPALMRRLVSALAGSGRSLIFLSGTGVLMQRTGGAWSPDVFAQDDPFAPEPLALPRIEAETIVRDAASPSLRTLVIRPPIIWGPGDNGPVAQVYRSVATTGTACYIGEGLAAYSNVHADDLAVLFERAIERGRAGALYHGVAGEIPNRWIAEAVARDLNVAARTITMAEAHDVFGPFGALILSASSRTRDPRTRAELGWQPTRTDMLTQIGEPRLRALASPHHEEKTHEHA